MSSAVRPVVSKSVPMSGLSQSMVRSPLLGFQMAPGVQGAQFVQFGSLGRFNGIQPSPLQLSFFPRAQPEPVAPVVEAETVDEANDKTVHLDSVLRKRRLKMKKHKLRKRRKRQRSLKIRLGKI